MHGQAGLEYKLLHGKGHKKVAVECSSLWQFLPKANEFINDSHNLFPAYTENQQTLHILTFVNLEKTCTSEFFKDDRNCTSPKDEFSQFEVFGINQSYEHRNNSSHSGELPTKPCSYEQALREDIDHVIISRQ